MELNISYDHNIDKIKFIKSDIFPNAAWSTIKSILETSQNEVLEEVENDKGLIAEVNSFKECLKGNGLKSLRERYGFIINFDSKTISIIQTYIKNLKNVQRIKNTKNLNTFNEKKIIEKIKNNGFNKFELTKNQIRDLKKIINIQNGANFSVPGSGKTAVSLATHLFFQDEFDSLIVICPKNAFMAWDENIENFLDDTHELKIKKLTRLVGNSNNIKNLLLSGKKYFIVNYQRIESIIDDLRIFLQNNNTHLILDESHKIKNREALVTRSVLQISSYPVKKQILSGTPMPKGIEDIISQFEFLHDTGLSDEVFNNYQDSDENLLNLRKYFVRTKKNELGLKKPKIIPINVEMSKAQMALYSYAMSPLLRLSSNIGNFQNIARLKRSLIRLIAISSNPQITFQRWLGEDIDAELTDMVEDSIVNEIISEGFSNKVKKACEITRKNAANGEKTIIWSFFRYNVELIANELSDLDAEYIHGSVETGDENDLETREGKIKKFKNNDNCKVLVANFAACAEGISLHEVCNTSIYLDRGYQLEQYLQSVDRIHRLGNDDQKYVYLLKSITPKFVVPIDESVSRNLERKQREMGEFLQDEDLIGLADDEYDSESPIDETINENDLKAIIDEIIQQN